MITILLQLASAAQFCDTGKNICVEAEVKEGNIQFTILSSAAGWASVGYSPKGVMAGATTYTAWMNSKGEPMIQQGSSTGPSMPAFNPKISATVSKTNATKPDWAKIAVSFTRPISDSDTVIQGVQKYIWAYSAKPPAEIDNLQSSYSLHDAKGAFEIDFAAKGGKSTTAEPLVPLPSSWKYETVIIIHAIFMFLAWGIFPIIAIYIAACMKHIGHKWYQLHSSIFIFGTGLFSAAGLFMAYGFRAAPTFPTYFHGINGVVISIVAILQGILGYVINSLWNPNRSSIPWHDNLHRGVGYLLCSFATLNITYGFTLAYERYGGSYLILSWVHIILLLLSAMAIVYRQRKLRKEGKLL
jgi:hypothetical protein